MINIFIAVIAFLTGLYIGSIVFQSDKQETQQKPVVPVLPDDKSPVVISMVFRQPLTKHMLVEEVLKPQCYKFMCHFDIPNRLEVRVSKKFAETLDKLADKIMEWYCPDYNELLLIAHQEPNAAGGFLVDFTWKQPSHGVVDELGR